MLLLRFLRKISIYFTKLFLSVGMTANQVTILSIFTGIAAATSLAFGRWLSAFGALLLLLSIIFDGCDGEVARYRKSSSLTGTFLDLLNHRIVNPLVIICLSFGIYNTFLDSRVFYFGFSALLSEELMVFVRQSKLLSIGRTIDMHKQIENNSPKMYNTRGHDKKKTYISKSLTIHNILQMMYFPFSDLGRPFVILLASLIDIIMPYTLIWDFGLNTMYLYLITYGLLGHVFWLGFVYIVMKRKSFDSV